MPSTFADRLQAASEDQSLTADELRAWMRGAAHRLRNAEPATQAESLDLINEAIAHYRDDEAGPQGSAT